jgi:nucleoside-diphosphate-sugar epimerase
MCEVRDRIYIVADDRPYSQREIAQTIAELLGDSRKIHRLPFCRRWRLG